MKGQHINDFKLILARKEHKLASRLLTALARKLSS